MPSGIPYCIVAHVYFILPSDYFPDTLIRIIRVILNHNLPRFALSIAPTEAFLCIVMHVTAKCVMYRVF
jgi:hypothetical protein